jgi:hypothetical protein
MRKRLSAVGARRPARWRRYVTVTTFAVAILLGASSALANVAGAGFTTDDPAVTAACLNGPSHLTPSVNCNIYGAKEDVWINGGPSGGQNHLSDGSYFFAVLDPGGQPDPNDGSAKNLSSPNDAYTDRTFTVSGGHVDGTYLGPHLYDLTGGGDASLGELIQLAPYVDTTNPGGVYILAICSLGSGYPVDARDCKYDAFKVKAGGCDADCGPPPAPDLTGSKTANPEFTREFNWTIGKSVDACAVVNNVGGCNITGSSKTLNYTVSVSHDAGSDSGWKVSGDVTVTNNATGNANLVTVSDSTDVGGTCTVHTDVNQSLDPAGGTLNAGDTALYPYDCTFLSNPGNGTNTAIVSWDPNLSDGSLTPDSSFPATATFSFSDPSTVIHNCVDATDSYAGVLGTVCVGDSNPTTFNYSRVVNVPHDCVTVNNTATFTVQHLDSDGDDTGSSSVTAKVCRTPARTGALTMGFWQNKNGQLIISGGSSTAGVCNAGTWLRTFAPFQDLSTTATCSQVATYVYNVIKAAICTSTSKTCNSMLKAQDLATSLDVYFSDPALGTNKIGAPSPVGLRQIDLTQICNMVDGSGGSATCSGSYQNASSVFGGNSCLYVYNLAQATDILRYAAGQSNVGGTTWYAQVKANQVLAKNVFDAINNQAAFTC